MNLFFLRGIGSCMLVLAACLGAQVAATTFTLTLNPARDNTLVQTASGSDVSNGSGPVFFAGRTNQASNNLRRGLLAFDLSALPPGAQITSAALTLNVSQTVAPALTFSLHRLNANWGEGSSSTTNGQGAAPAANDATWFFRNFNTLSWSAPGGDYNASASATTQVGGVGAYTWSSAQMVADLQGWFVAPAGNFGWIVIGDESVTSAKRFDSRENATVGNRPLLSIRYTDTVPVGLSTFAEE